MSYKFLIKGVVQGVGFRPYVYNACKKAGVRGYVQNTGDGVVIVADNRQKVEEILQNTPPLSRIDKIEVQPAGGSYEDFKIIESGGGKYSEIPADLFLCEDCARELDDNGNRRHGYFFITCTNCGPRFSIVKQTPYDRANTTMSDFPMCDACQKEYKNPADRRYHAQTIACRNCGPRIQLLKNGKPAGGIKEAADAIKNGGIVAIKGVGGFHLACGAKPRAVQKLRALTGRPHKPYAILARDIQMAKEIAHVTDGEEKELQSKRRPIVVIKAKRDLREISELKSFGIMLPYTALHYLLFKYLDEPIVMTSSNLPDEPLTSRTEEQFTECVLDHTRKIQNPVDDSVLKVINKNTMLLRRSRGYVPESTKLGGSNKQILALGAELTNAFCVYKDQRATLSQYIGTTSNILTFERLKSTLDNFLRFTACEPEIILCDLHPAYNTSKYAAELSQKLQIPLHKVQHHKAHIYSAAAEYELGDFAGIACDGLGYGEDGTIWGGEIFLNNERVGHLEKQTQVGGDSATMYPAKMLFGILSNFLSRRELEKYLADYFTTRELAILQKQKEERFNSPETSSCGRILDAASCLLGFCDRRTYEGRPAMLLEANSTEPYDLEPIIKNNILLTTPIFEWLISNFEKDKSRLAATVQLYLARGLYQITRQYKKPIVFGGGCAYNSIMTSFMLDHGVLINKKVPAGDGGVSFGQIGWYLANHK